MSAGGAEATTYSRDLNKEFLELQNDPSIRENQELVGNLVAFWTEGAVIIGVGIVVKCDKEGLFVSGISLNPGFTRFVVVEKLLLDHSYLIGAIPNDVLDLILIDNERNTVDTFNKLSQITKASKTPGYTNVEN